ncbi:MAG: O-methyltransferase [Gaiellaceae bacterium]
MPSTLLQDPVRSVLAGLRAYAAVEDPRAAARVHAREAELGERLGTAEKYALYGDAPPLAVSEEVGDLLYVLARACRPHLAVEFGASRGVSTIHLAAALRDAGRGSLVTTEILPAKAAATRDALADAGLDDLVDLRAGDALETLRELPRPVDLLFLDGRNDLYLAVLRLLEPRLSPAALVVADLSGDDPALVPYLEHVRTGTGAYLSLAIPLGSGVEVSLHLP